MWIINNLVLAKAIQTWLYPNDATNKLAELDITLVFYARTAKHVTEESLAPKIEGKRGKTNMHMGIMVGGAVQYFVFRCQSVSHFFSSARARSLSKIKLCAKNIWFRFCYVARVPNNPWIRHMDVAKGYGGTKKHAIHMRPRTSARAKVLGLARRWAAKSHLFKLFHGPQRNSFQPPVGIVLAMTRCLCPPKSKMFNYCASKRAKQTEEDHAKRENIPRTGLTGNVKKRRRMQPRMRSNT